MASFSFTVNGSARTVKSWDPAEPLLYVLRNQLGLNGPKFGCGLCQCGACTVLLEGEATRSCSIAVSDVAGKSVTTLEGLGTPAKPHQVQAALANAIFDATGVRFRTVPFTPERVKAALIGH